MKFDSRYSPNKKITAAQYITELICEKRALSLNKDLPIYFWRLPEWKGYFLYQIRLAYKLLKQYDANIIIQALHDSKNIFSLNNKILVNKIKLLQQRSYIENRETTFEFSRSISEQRKPFHAPSIIDILKQYES